MKNSILLGIWRLMLRIPRPIWEQEVRRSAESAKKSLTFMTPDHHRVRDFVVREMPRIGEPIKPEQISDELRIPLERVISILNELEKNMTFLFRDEQGAVIWAYPVTVTQTPHQITFNSGETIYAA
jgi:hypothetical protein